MAWLALTGALILLLFDSTFLTSDALMALAWGDLLAHGGSPATDAPLVPVFHPLPTAFGVLVSPFGTEFALGAYRLSAVVALAALGYSSYRLGRSLGGAAAGVLAAGLILTRPEVVEYARISAIDIPFAAFVLLAGALAIEGPRANRWWVLTLLGLAGLLRPEVWVLALAYGAWLARGASGPGQRAGILGAAAAAPVIWLAADTLFTGNPLSSALQARAGLDGLAAAGFEPIPADYAVSVGTGIQRQWEALTALLGWPLAIGGLAAALWAVARGGIQRRPGDPAPDGDGEEPLGAETAAALVALGALLLLGTLLAFAMAGLPFTSRFVILTAAALAVLFAYALVRFLPPLLWRAGLVAVCLGVLLTLPGDLRTILDGRATGRGAVENLSEVSALARSPDVAEAIEGCPSTGAGGELFVVLGVAVLSMATDTDPADIEIQRRPGAEFETVLTFDAAPGIGAGPGPRPRALVGRNGNWEVWSRCAAPAGP